MLDRMVMPTPAAVLAAGELFARGAPNQPGLGDLMIVDVGGATTDVHSYVEQTPYDGAKMIGVPEPYVKRTVEGDLGIRESSNSLCVEIGMDRMQADTGLPPQQIGQVVERWVTQNRELAQNNAQRSVDRALAAGAVRISSTPCRDHPAYFLCWPENRTAWKKPHHGPRRYRHRWSAGFQRQREVRLVPSPSGQGSGVGYPSARKRGLLPGPGLCFLCRRPSAGGR